MARIAAIQHQGLKRHLTTLATIGYAAPLIGILGTVCGLMFDTFLGFDGDKVTGMALVAERISLACWPTAIGILVGLQSLWAYRYFENRLADLDREMATGCQDLINRLVPHLSSLRPAGQVQEMGDSLPYLEAYSSGSRLGRTYPRFGPLITALLIFAAWGMQVAERLNSVDFDAMTVSAVFVAGLFSLFMIFLCACFPVYLVWVDLMDRDAAGVALIAAVLSLAWCVAELAYPSLRI